MKRFLVTMQETYTVETAAISPDEAADIAPFLPEAERQYETLLVAEVIELSAQSPAQDEGGSSHAPPTL